MEPYMGIEDQDKEYHFALLHLKTPFDFSSAYVRQLCMEEVGQQNVKSQQTPNSTLAVLLQGGFAKYKIRNDDNQTTWGTKLKIQRVEVKSGYECVQSYEHYYNSDFPAGMFCAQLPEGTVGKSDTCKFLMDAQLYFQNCFCCRVDSRFGARFVMFASWKRYNTQKQRQSVVSSGANSADKGKKRRVMQE